jgi:BirA family biotin operon repressor/biotin-[acetyl-CoA-carboxylase] ligase
MAVHNDVPPIERIFPSLEIGGRWLHYSAVPSTNTVAATLAEDGANHGIAISADSQSAGRGQYERIWTVPPDSAVLMSVLLFPSVQFRRPAILTAWAAVSVCETIRIATGLEASIKWPNDVLVQGRKICGILCEGGAQYMVAGIGVNVNQTAADFEQTGLPDATSLAIESGLRFDITEMTERLLRQLDAEYRRLVGGDHTSLELNWKARMGLLGRSVCIDQMDGNVLSGRLIEQSFGVLRIASDEGVRELTPEMVRHMSLLPAN